MASRKVVWESSQSLRRVDIDHHKVDEYVLSPLQWPNAYTLSATSITLLRSSLHDYSLVATLRRHGDSHHRRNRATAATCAVCPSLHAIAVTRFGSTQREQHRTTRGVPLTLRRHACAWAVSDAEELS